MPCDEDEQTRMWMLHEVYFDVLGQSIILAFLNAT
jgi:hypothetical protein